MCQNRRQQCWRAPGTHTSFALDYYRGQRDSGQRPVSSSLRAASAAAGILPHRLRSSRVQTFHPRKRRPTCASSGLFACNPHRSDLRPPLLPLQSAVTRPSCCAQTCCAPQRSSRTDASCLCFPFRSVQPHRESQREPDTSLHFARCVVRSGPRVRSQRQANYQI